MLDFDSEVTVRRTRFANPDSGWAVLDAVDSDGDAVVLVGPLTHLEERERVHVKGTWVDDSRFGIQVKVSEAHRIAPTDAASIATLLVRVKHVGGARAARLIDRYGAAGVLDTIDSDPRSAF